MKHWKHYLNHEHMGSSFIDNCNWNPIPKNVMRFFLQMISKKNILGRNINFYDSTLTT